MIDLTKFTERFEKIKSSIPPSDNIIQIRIHGLYIKVYEPKRAVDDVLIVYHGGGVNSDAGYEILARQLCHALKICVCLVDIRGHGRSAGIREYASSPGEI